MKKISTELVIAWYEDLWRNSYTPNLQQQYNKSNLLDILWQQDTYQELFEMTRQLRNHTSQEQSYIQAMKLLTLYNIKKLRKKQEVIKDARLIWKQVRSTWTLLMDETTLSKDFLFFIKQLGKVKDHLSLGWVQDKETFRFLWKKAKKLWTIQKSKKSQTKSYNEVEQTYNYYLQESEQLLHTTDIETKTYHEIRKSLSNILSVHTFNYIDTLTNDRLSSLDLINRDVYILLDTLVKRMWKQHDKTVNEHNKKADHILIDPQVQELLWVYLEWNDR